MSDPAVSETPDFAMCLAHRRAVLSQDGRWLHLTGFACDPADRTPPLPGDWYPGWGRANLHWIWHSFGTPPRTSSEQQRWAGRAVTPGALAFFVPGHDEPRHRGVIIGPRGQVAARDE